MSSNLRALALAALLAITMAFVLPRLTGPQEVLVVATTTSLYDTGLCELLEEAFEEEFGVDVRFIPEGTGRALKRAEMGDADLVLVHAPALERDFLARGYGVAREVIAYNFFAIVGPNDDPAGIRGLTPIEAMRRIAEAGRDGKLIWISRGDLSGTHVKELKLWREAGFDPDVLSEEPSWYRASGVGMGATLLMADEKGAYTLTDVGTYLRYKQRGLIALDTMVSRGKALLNIYSVIATNPERHPHVNFDAATLFIRFLTSERGQSIIASLRALGEPLFYPAVELLREDADPELVSWIREIGFFDGVECPPELWASCEDLYE